MNEPSVSGAPDLSHHADILREALLSLCGPLDSETQASLLNHIQLVHLEVGDTLYRQGESGSSMHIVLTGRLRVAVLQGDGGGLREDAARGRHRAAASQ